MAVKNCLHLFLSANIQKINIKQQIKLQKYVLDSTWCFGINRTKST